MPHSLDELEGLRAKLRQRHDVVQDDPKYGHRDQRDFDRRMAEIDQAILRSKRTSREITAKLAGAPTGPGDYGFGNAGPAAPRPPFRPTLSAPALSPEGFVETPGLTALGQRGAARVQAAPGPTDGGGLLGAGARSARATADFGSATGTGFARGVADQAAALGTTSALLAGERDVLADPYGVPGQATYLDPRVQAYQRSAFDADQRMNQAMAQAGLAPPQMNEAQLQQLEALTQRPGLTGARHLREAAAGLMPPPDQGSSLATQAAPTSPSGSPA